jgi:hypothetical protein
LLGAGLLVLGSSPLVFTWAIDTEEAPRQKPSDFISKPLYEKRISAQRHAAVHAMRIVVLAIVATVYFQKRVY